MSRRHPVLVALLGAALLLAGCGGGGDGDDAAAADGGGDPTCAALEASVLEPVEDPGPDEGPEDAPPDPDEAEAQEEAVAALERLAADGPEELRDDAAAVATTEDLDPDAVTDAEVDELAAAAERLVAWGVERCELDGPVWGCVRRGSFRQVDMGIDGDAPAGGSPEEAAGDAEGERVEVGRTDDRVTFAWLDADGLAVRSETVVEDDGTWASERSSHCNG
jgi:hypothetical protein